MKFSLSILLVFFFSLSLSAQAQNCCIQCRSVKDSTTNASKLTELRSQIDSLDNVLVQVLSKRLKVCKEVGQFKKKEGIAVVQSNRYNELVNRLCVLGKSLGLTECFVKQIMDTIHEESVRQQNELVGTKESDESNNAIKD